MITLQQTGFAEARISPTTVWNGAGGFGAALTPAAIDAMAAGLVKEAFPDYRGAFLTVDKADRQALAAALIAKGADSSRVNAALASANFSVFASSPQGTVWKVLSAASLATSVYFGYKRHNSGWGAIGWGLLGGLFPVFVPAYLVASRNSVKK